MKTCKNAWHFHIIQVSARLSKEEYLLLEYTTQFWLKILFELNLIVKIIQACSEINFCQVPKINFFNPNHFTDQAPPQIMDAPTNLW